MELFKQPIKCTITNDDTHLKENYLFFPQTKFALTYYQLLSPAGTVASSNKLPKFFLLKFSAALQTNAPELFPELFLNHHWHRLQIEIKS